MDLQRCRILGKDGELYGVSGCIKTQIFIALGKEILADRIAQYSLGILIIRCTLRNQRQKTLLRP